MRIQNSLVRSTVLCGLTLGALLAAAGPAAAETTLVETNGWTFFTDGRINTFYSQGFGDDFPNPTPNPGTGMDGSPNPGHTIVGSGQPFTAGFPSDQGTVDGKYYASRLRSGFLGSIIAFGMRREVTEETTVKSYIALWGTAHSYARDRLQDQGKTTSKGLDVREAWINFDGPWGSFTAGRQSGILGGISTEIDFKFGHNFGVGLPCLDIYYPACGHIGTGALGPGNAAGFVYVTPSLGGLKLIAGLYDPVRLLGVWERVPIPRPEGALSFERALTPSVKLKLRAEGMYQPMIIRASNPERRDQVWGVAGGGYVEAGPLRLGFSAFRGKGLGSYVALQNAGSTFSTTTQEFRYFTGVYGQLALVFGGSQFSAGLGRVIDDQLASDKVDATTSGLKAQTGFSLAFYQRVAENVVIGLDYFRFQANWWGAPNSTTDMNGAVVILPGVLTPEKQVVNFLNLGATYHW